MRRCEWWSGVGRQGIMMVIGNRSKMTKIHEATTAEQALSPEALIGPSLLPDATRFVHRPSLHRTLIAPPVGFVGREVALEEIQANFERGVLITSASGNLGCGLTALARRLAQMLSADFPDGCLEIDLRGGMPESMEPMDSIEAQRRLLRSFLVGTPLPEDEKVLDRLYRDTFASRRVLLLLDNAAGSVQLRRLMPRKPSAAIVTARESFPVLAKLCTYTLEELSSDEGRAIVAGVAPHCATLSQRTINRLLERFTNPLALRIAAALLREPTGWTARELLAAYSAALKRLKALRASDRHLDITIAMELAYEALPADARPFFEALGVLSAPFSTAAAAAVWKVDVNAADAMLVRLVRSNLVTYYPNQDTYALHDLVLLYAQELLLGQPDRVRVVVARFAHYMLAEAGLVSDRLRVVETPVEESWTRVMTLWPHLWVAWRRMSGADPGWIRPLSADRWMVDFLTRLLPLLNVMLPVSERVAILENGLEAARRLDGAAEVVILSSLGQVCGAQGDLSTALDYHEQHRRIAVELHDRKNEAEALMYIGTTCGGLGDVKRAQENWRHALALFRMLEDPRAAQVRLWLDALDKRLGGN